MAIAELYDRASSLLERRFLKNAFLPVAVFPVVLAWPFLMQSSRLDRAAAWWEALSTAGKVVLGLVYFVVTWFFAAIVASQWRNIIRLFEGYPFIHSRLAQRSTDWHKERWHEATQWETYSDFPDEDEVMPTRLGNILRAAERYANARYRADTIVLWSRLYHVLPETLQRDVADRRATVEFLLVTSLFWGAFGVVDFVALLLTGSPAWMACLCLLIGAAGAALAYQSCLPAAVEYGEQLKAAVELHRLRLLAALGFRLPADHDDEEDIWEAVIAFVRQGKKAHIDKFRQVSAPQADGP